MGQFLVSDCLRMNNDTVHHWTIMHADEMDGKQKHAENEDQSADL